MRPEGAPGGFTIPLPEDWVSVEPPPGALLVALEPSDGERFRANVVVTRDDVGEMGLHDWQAGTDRLLPGSLQDYLLIDLELLEVAGRAGVRRLAHHTASTAALGPQAVTMEQWATLVDGTGWTVTLTVPTLRYPALREGLRAVPAGLTISPGEGSR